MAISAKAKKFIGELSAVKQTILDYTRTSGKLELVEVEVSPTVYVRDGLVVVSAEDGNAFADYYSEDETIHPKLTKLAEKHGVYWDWESAGAIYISLNSF